MVSLVVTHSHSPHTHTHSGKWLRHLRAAVFGAYEAQVAGSHIWINISIVWGHNFAGVWACISYWDLCGIDILSFSGYSYFVVVELWFFLIIKHNLHKSLDNAISNGPNCKDFDHLVSINRSHRSLAWPSCRSLSSICRSCNFNWTIHG